MRYQLPLSLSIAGAIAAVASAQRDAPPPPRGDRLRVDIDLLDDARSRRGTGIFDPPQRVNIDVLWGGRSLRPSEADCIAELTSSELRGLGLERGMVIVRRGRGSYLDSEPDTLEPSRQWSGSDEGSRQFAELFDPLVDVVMVRGLEKRRTYHISVTCLIQGRAPLKGMGGITLPPLGDPSWPSASDDLVFPPQPGRPGGWGVCQHDYDLYGILGQREKQGEARIYAPVVETRPCGTYGEFDLVVIAHADGLTPSPGYLQYEDLALHLASNAFMVLSVNRYVYGTTSGAIDHFGDLVRDHLEYLYGDNSPVKGRLTDRWALIGHSAGGKSSTQHAEDLAGFPGKDLVGLAVLAPTVDLNVERSFLGVVDAFLGMHGTHDTDGFAFGRKFPGEPMESTFKIYDDARVVKDMVFIKYAPHNFQNSATTLAYINTFLQLNLHGHGIYDRFLKLQERPPSFGQLAPIPILWQQHSDAIWFDGRVLANFEFGDVNTNNVGGEIAFSADWIDQEEVGESYVIDDYSPHTTRVLKFRLVANSDPGGDAQPDYHVRFAFPEDQPADLSPYQFVSFRATQVYDPDDVDGAPPLPIALTLADEGGNAASVVLEDLHFPVDASAPANGLGIEKQTKNAMRSYIVRLMEYQLQGVDDHAVASVTVSFPSQSPGYERVVILDDVEFYV